MTMQLVDPNTGEVTDALAEFDTETGIDRVDTKAVAVITKSEVEAQLSAAHQHPRSVKRFLQEAIGLATLNRDIAESCIYALPRDGKTIAGPSVRLAEICASAYGNMHYGARVVDEDSKTVTSQGVAWDLEKNVRVTVETKRRVTTKSGRRFSDDMVVMAGNAAASISLRNAVFRVVPRAYVNMIYDQVRRVAVGDAKTLDTRRSDVIARLLKIGVPTDRVLARLNKKAVEDIGLEDLEVLIGLGSAIKNGEQQIDDAFPAVSAPALAPAAEDGKRIKLGGNKKQEQPATTTAREPGEE